MRVHSYIGSLVFCALAASALTVSSFVVAQAKLENIDILQIEASVALSQLESDSNFLDTFATTPAAQPLQALSSIDQERLSYFGLALQQGASMESLIDQLQQGHEPWSETLAVELATLGKAFFGLGRYQEAYHSFDRALHIRRVNNGLYSTEQIPLIQATIDTLAQLQWWEQLDELQEYSYFLHNRSFNLDDPEIIAGLQSFADWNIQAHYLGLESSDGARLRRSTRLYADVAMAVEKSVGQQDRRYLGALSRVLKANTLLQQLDEDRSGQSTSLASLSSPASQAVGQPSRTLISAVDAQRVAKHIIQSEPKTSDSDNTLSQIERLIALGDWHFLQGTLRQASDAYAQAYQLLATAPELSQEQRAALDEQLFNQVSIAIDHDMFPDLRKQALGIGLDSGARLGYIDLDFSVSRYGRIHKIKVLNAHPEIDTAIARRLMLEVAEQDLRPRIPKGQFARSENEQYRFVYWYSQH